MKSAKQSKPTTRKVSCVQRLSLRRIEVVFSYPVTLLISTRAIRRKDIA